MSRIFASFGIPKGFAAASILTVVASAPASAQFKWDLSTVPMQYPLEGRQRRASG